MGVHEMSVEDGAECGAALVRVAKAVGATDYNVLQNNGAAAHQAVGHVHFHIIPKPSQDQGLGVGWPSKPVDHAVAAAMAAEFAKRI
eukprot:NODE_9053_length_384_cov_83.238806_g8158_i0.p2 GENE.NODE_9053_length_384_cov_83.238806_g8158_i0~~NODE_9053_length_384_cov_83.238806_g8158_i0.p2  ORF type:complete len:96 (-),score=39.65 NODE_9053_length_384_cov_83.238806_g8158_i0:97-357(-)